MRDVSPFSGRAGPGAVYSRVRRALAAPGSGFLAKAFVTSEGNFDCLIKIFFHLHRLLRLELHCDNITLPTGRKTPKPEWDSAAGPPRAAVAPLVLEANSGSPSGTVAAGGLQVPLGVGDVLLLDFSVRATAKTLLSCSLRN